MMEDNNNLEDFFKKQFDKEASPKDAWDKPDADVWEKSQSQFFRTKPNQRNKRAFIWLAVAGLLLLLSFASYNFYLQSNLSQLTKQFHQLEKNHQQLQETFDSFKTKAHLEKTALIQQNKQIKINHHQVLEQVQIGETNKHINQQAIDQLKLDKLVLAESLEKATNALKVLQIKKQSKNSASTSSNLAMSTAKIGTIDPVSSLPLQSLKQEVVVDNKLMNLPITIIPSRKKSWKKQELGLAYSFQSINVTSSFDFENQESIKDNLANESFIVNAKAIHFSRAIKPNWFLKFGMRYFSYVDDRELKSGLIYDKSGEYINSNGKLANDLKLTTNTNYNEVQNDISIEIPTGTTLENGDLLVTELEHYEKYFSFQIPLGIEYFQGNNRWQWQLQGGFKWNKVFVGNYLIAVDIESKNLMIPVEKIKVLSESETTKQFFSSYLGAGLNYRLFDQWYARAVLIYEYDFNQSISQFSKTNILNNNLEFSINYRF